MKGRGGRSRGMEALNAEALAKIEPTDPLRIAKQAARRKIESRSAMHPRTKHVLVLGEASSKAVPGVVGRFDGDLCLMICRDKLC